MLPSIRQIEAFDLIRCEAYRVLRIFIVLILSVT